MSTPPIPYNRQASFMGFSTEQHPAIGQDLEAEFGAIRQCLEQTQDRLAQILRDDGLLASLSVHPDAPSQAVRPMPGAEAGTPKGNWRSGLVYNPKDIVRVGATRYLAVVEHVTGADFSTDLAAGKWQPLSSENDDTLRADLASPSNGGTLVGFQQAGSGAVARTTRDKLREFASANDFGAKFDGVTDDTAAIQAAVNAHSRVYIGPGTALISAAIVMRSNSALIGTGPDTIIKVKDGANCHGIVNADAVNGNEGIHLANFTVDGNKQNRTVGQNRRCIELRNCRFVDIYNVTVKNSQDHGLYSPGVLTAGWTVVGVRAIDCGQAGELGGSGIVLPSKSAALGCYASGCYLNGFKSGGHGLSYIGCHATQNNGGFDTGTTTGAVEIQRYIKFVGCEAFQNNSYGFVIGTESTHVELIGCTAAENKNDGLFVYQSVNNLTVLGGYFMRNGKGGTVGVYPGDQRGKWGINITDSGASPCNNVTIVGATIGDDAADFGGSATQEIGLVIRGTGTNIKIKDCRFFGNLNQPMNVSSNGSSIEVTGCAGLTMNEALATVDVAVTGTTTETVMHSLAAKEDEARVGQIMRVQASGTVTGTSGTKIIRFNDGTTSQVVANFAAGEIGAWTADIEVFFKSKSVQIWRGTVSKAGVVTGVMQQVNKNFATGDVTLRVTGQLGNAADSIVLNGSRFWTIR